MPGAGDLNQRWRFQPRGEDANGDRTGGWEEGFTVWAQVVWLRGTEAVMQDRLSGMQPVIITVRASLATRGITPGFRAVDARNAKNVANVTAVAPAREAGFIDILATVGVAQG